MKKIIAIALILAAGTAHALIEKATKIGPATAAPSVWAPGSGDQAVSLASATTAGFRTCLSKLTVTSNASLTLRILNGPTTAYHVSLATTVAGSQLVHTENWNEDDMCTSASNRFHIKVSTSNGPQSSIQINYSGFTY